MVNIYNYQLLFSIIQNKYFPLLFRKTFLFKCFFFILINTNEFFQKGDLGISSSTIQRQLFQIHYGLAIDRPSINKPFLNDQILSFVTKVIISNYSCLVLFQFNR